MTGWHSASCCSLRSPKESVPDDPADFPRAWQDQCRGHRTLVESLGGVRLVKGYHAEEREEKVFSGGVLRLLNNVMRTLTATRHGLSASVLLGWSCLIMFVGTRQILAGSLTIGGFSLYLVQGFSSRPCRSFKSAPNYRSFAGLERT